MFAPLVRSCRVLAAVAALSIVPAAVFAGSPPTRYFDGAAREIVSSLQSGEGWVVVSDRQMVEFAGIPMDSVRYRVVSKYESGTTSNDQFYVEVVYGEETPWILTELKMPTASCPSLTAAKHANEAIAMIDEVVGEVQAQLPNEPNAEVRELGRLILEVFGSQRAALVDLIRKDLRSIEL